MLNAWAESTHKAYSSGILAYHVYCDKMEIPEEKRTPTSQLVIASFIASMAGAYSGASISNYIYGIRAWHILHGLKWELNQLKTDALLKGADCMTLSSSKKKKRQPYTPEFMSRIHEQLNLEDLLDTTVFACLTTCFYSAAQLGEFLIPRLDSFNSFQHITIAAIRSERNQGNQEVMALYIPHTKAAPIEGEDVFWSRQPGPTDPYQALDNYQQVNNPSINDHLFSYKHRNRMRPLTKPAFIKCVPGTAGTAGLEPLQGHGIRIDTTLFYLLKGVPIETIKVMGRWSSDAFLCYLHKHAQILTPYIQANSELHNSFTHFIISNSQPILQARH